MIRPLDRSEFLAAMSSVTRLFITLTGEIFASEIPECASAFCLVKLIICCLQVVIWLEIGLGSINNEGYFYVEHLSELHR
ncbi:hypothetical protein ACTXT7_003865 [Hymenolepis weldensis]